jgi:protein-tyrosine sulfotransferase
VALIERLILTYQITITSDSTLTNDDRANMVAKKVRSDINRIMNEHANQLGKRVWCEKSVYTIDRIADIDFVFPNARYICLYRNCLDQVYSALETLEQHPKGEGYGYAPFLSREPENPVDALVDYWCAKTSAILSFEQSKPSQCFRLRYEDLVLESNAQLERLFRFLGSYWKTDMLDSIFTKSRRGGPGDHKILQTDRILTSSIGRGKELGNQNISANLLNNMNILQTALGY